MQNYIYSTYLLSCLCKQTESIYVGPSGFSWHFKLAGTEYLQAECPSLPCANSISTHWRKRKFKSPGRLTVRTFSKRTTEDCADGGHCRWPRRRWRRQPCLPCWGCAASHPCLAQHWRHRPATWWRRAERPTSGHRRHRHRLLLKLLNVAMLHHREERRYCSPPSLSTRTAASAASSCTWASLLTYKTMYTPARYRAYCAK